MRERAESPRPGPDGPIPWKTLANMANTCPAKAEIPPKQPADMAHFRGQNG